MSPPVSPRPLVPLAAAFAMGVLLGGHVAGAVVAGSGAAICTAGWLLTRRPGLRSAAVLLAFAFAGALRCGVTASPRSDDVSRLASGRFATLEGVVASDVEPGPWDFGCDVDVTSVRLPDGRVVRCSGRAAVRLRREERADPPDYGDRVTVRGVLDQPSGLRNEGGFDYGAWLARRGIYATVATRRPTDWRVLERGGGSPVGRLAYRARASLLGALARLLPPTEAALLGGILLGARSRMPPALDDDFAATGTAHILATAGLHVGILALLLVWLCQVLRIPGRPAAVLQIASLALYALMAGGRPSVSRAVLISVLYLAGGLLDRENDGPNALAAAALILLVYNPGSLYEPGFQLSFATVAVIFALMPLFDERIARLLPAPQAREGRSRRLARGAARWALRMAALSAAAQIGSAPLTAQHFNVVSLVGIPANVLVVPALIPLMASGLAAWPLVLLWPAGAHATLGPALGFLLRYVMGAAHTCAVVPGASLPVPSPGWLVVGLCYVAIGGVAWRLRSKDGPLPGQAPGAAARRRWVLAASAAGAAVLVVAVYAAARPAQRILTVTFLDVGQGDAIVVQTPAGHTLVVDAGPQGTEDDAGRRTVVPYLRAHGISHIDALAVTHPDADHAGGAASVLARVGVGRLLVAGPVGGGLAEEAAKQGRIPVVPLDRDETLRFGDGVAAEVLNPPAGLPASEPHRDNNGSLVMRLRYGSTSLLLAGDAEADAEAAMLRRPDALPADVLKLGHHGSLSASSSRFLDAVHPRAAIVSAGKRNLFGHPHPAVLARLEARGTRVFRTDRDGAVTVTSDGRTLRVTCMGAAPPP